MLIVEPHSDRGQLIPKEYRWQSHLSHQWPWSSVLVPYQVSLLVVYISLVKILNSIHIQVVVGQQLSLVKVLILINLGSVQVIRVLLSIPLLNLLGFLISAKWEVVNFVGKVKSLASHVETLHHISKGMCWDVEVAWDSVDDHCSFQVASLLVIKRLDSLLKDTGLHLLIHHYILFTHLQYVYLNFSYNYCISRLKKNSIFVKSVFEKLPMHIHYVSSCDINHIQTENMARTLRQGYVQINIQL